MFVRFSGEDCPSLISSLAVMPSRQRAADDEEVQVVYQAGGRSQGNAPRRRPVRRGGARQQQRQQQPRPAPPQVAPRRIHPISRIMRDTLRVLTSRAYDEVRQNGFYPQASFLPQTEAWDLSLHPTVSTLEDLDAGLGLDILPAVGLLGALDPVRVGPLPDLMNLSGTMDLLLSPLPPAVQEESLLPSPPADTSSPSPSVSSPARPVQEGPVQEGPGGDDEALLADPVNTGGESCVVISDSEDESGNTVEEESGNTLEEESGNTVEEESTPTLEEESTPTMEEESARNLGEKSSTVEEESTGASEDGPGSAPVGEDPREELLVGWLEGEPSAEMAFFPAPPPSPVPLLLPSMDHDGLDGDTQMLRMSTPFEYARWYRDAKNFPQRFKIPSGRLIIYICCALIVN